MREPTPDHGHMPPIPFPTYELDDAYDEMFTPEGAPRPEYELLFQRLPGLTPTELQARQQSADLSFLAPGDHIHRLRRRTRH